MDEANFYDDFVSVQIESGINDRIHTLYKKLSKLGIKSNERLLEVGCGIGALTFLLARKVKRGTIESFDPSAKSIAFASECTKAGNVHFFTGDVLTYVPASARQFDKILLFDVLEHIPEADHAAVFRKLENFLEDNGFLLINIPNPEYILYDQKHQPELLQEIDQAIYLQTLLPKIIDAKLELFYFETHSVWSIDDYQFMVLRKQKPFEEIFLRNRRNLAAKALLRLRRMFRNWRYRFPPIITKAQAHKARTHQ